MKKIECIIMDWAGTAVDYGCFAPVAAFIEAFAEKGLVIDVVQTRKPMGLPKIQHIRELLSMPDVNEQFTARYQRAWTEEDVVELNRLFEKHLFASLENYTDPIPGVIPTLEKLRAAGIKIGSTTGYTREMMDVVLPAAQAKGYHVDYCATPNLLPAGRPAPYMIFENLTKLAVPSLDAVIKVGDTIADILEGVNAKVYSVGVILGSNEMALTEALGKTNGAAALVEYMKKRYTTAPSEAAIKALSDKEYQTLILDERRREFYAEGMRWQDIKRTNRLELLETLDGRTYLMYYPIPQDEIDMAGTVAYPQNPGYAGYTGN